MRAITVASVLFAIGGCYASHLGDVPAGDGGPSDASPPPRDARADAADAADGGSDPLPSCRAPVDSWAPTLRRYPGEFMEAAVRLRDGERTWVAARSPALGLALVRFDETTEVPELLSATTLVTGDARPLAGAMDEARLSIVYLDASAQTHVDVFDPVGERLAEAAVFAEEATSATVAIRSARVGTALLGGVARVSVLDATGGLVFFDETLPDAAEISIGLGRGLFAAVVTEPSGRSRYWGVDERGTIDAGEIDARMLRMEWDGAAVVGWGRHELRRRRARRGRADDRSRKRRRGDRGRPFDRDAAG